MRPSLYPESVFSESKVSLNKKNQMFNDITQLWHVNGKCPKNTIPIRRTKKQDLYRANSVEKFGMKNQKSIPKPKSYEPAGVLTQNGHQVYAFELVLDHFVFVFIVNHFFKSFGLGLARDNVCRRWGFLRC